MKTSKQNTSKVQNTTLAALIASLYVILTWLSSMLGLASGAIQIRLSEALTILPCLTPCGIPGVTIGCFLGNLLTGAPLPDIIFGTLATLLGATGAFLLRRHPYFAPIPTIFSNALIIPFVLRYSYGIKDAFVLLFLTVGAGELLSAGVLGILLFRRLKKFSLF